MESTPVIGVEIKNEREAPRLAPLFLMLVASGMTPHDHTGKGTTKSVDLSTEEILSLPKCFVTKLSGTTSCKTPANKSPNKI